MKIVVAYQRQRVGAWCERWKVVSSVISAVAKKKKLVESIGQEKNKINILYTQQKK